MLLTTASKPTILNLTTSAASAVTWHPGNGAPSESLCGEGYASERWGHRVADGRRCCGLAAHGSIAGDRPVPGGIAHPFRARGTARCQYAGAVQTPPARETVAGRAELFRVRPLPAGDSGERRRRLFLPRSAGPD